MAEYIERNALYEKIARLEELARNRVVDTPSTSPTYMRYVGQLNERSALKHLIFDTPAADVAPVAHGRWEEIRDPYGMLTGWIHKECGREVKCADNYCPNCGAKMDLATEQEKV